MELVISLIFAMIGGLAMSRVVKLLHLPNVTGYLVAGLILGGYGLKLVDVENLEGLSVITSIALGFVAFSIGGEFKLKHLKQLGGQVLIITVVQACMAVALVIIGLMVVMVFDPEHVSMPVVLLLGAIASATAPAATLMVVRQYKAKGPVTDTLLPVVAFDDALGLIIFSVCMALSKMFASGEKLTVASVIFEPLREIVLSLVVGAVIGLLLSLLVKVFKSRANRLSLMLLSVLGGVVLSSIWHLSSLLTCMMIGAMFCNIRSDAQTILEGCDRWTPPLFMLFFVISGAELDLAVIPLVGVVGVVYLIMRSLGKYFGAFFGCVIAKSPKNVRNYLGITLLPQAGVAIGMAQMVAAEPTLEAIAAKVVTVTLSATLIYELIGPVLTKISLVKAGEIELPKKEDKVQKAK